MFDLQGWGPAFLPAIGQTVQTALLATAFGSVIGLVTAWGSMSSFKVLRRLADVYATVVRATPQLLLILVVYFGGTKIIQSVGAILGSTGQSLALPPVFAGVTALAVVFGAYASEVFRGAFLAVPRGMVEAATACGMTRLQVLRLVKIPQMLRFSLPGLGNIWISILKDTSLISVVGLEEIMRVSELATTDTQEPLLFYCVAAAIYFSMAIVSDTLLEKMEIRSRRGERSV